MSLDDHWLEAFPRLRQLEPEPARRLRESAPGLLALVEEVAFGRVDVRLAHWLLQHRTAGGQVRHTHQELAVELGTAREVVSRQLNFKG